MCVCLSVQLRLASESMFSYTSQVYSACTVNKINVTVWISLKMYELKVMTVNTFHGDPRPIMELESIHQHIARSHVERQV